MMLIDIEPILDAAKLAGKEYVSIDFLKGFEQVDAVPVVRGEWIEAKSGGMSVWPDGQVMCSVCKQRMPLAWKKMPPYCYGCGAQMEDKTCR